MSLFALFAILMALTALFAFVNEQHFHLPSTIGVMAVALGASLALIVVGVYVDSVGHAATAILASVDFNRLLLHGMLAFLLFAGSLHIDLSDLYRQRTGIALLAIVSTALSTFIVGPLAWCLLHLLGLHVPLLPCLVFGALISPTDPVAVLGIMKSARAPKDLEIQIAAESLFNDGIGVVLFMVLLAAAEPGFSASPKSIGLLLLREAGGGALVGLTLGAACYALLRRIDDYQVEAMLTIALAMGVYALAEAVEFSAPIAVVAAGLLIGNQGRALAMSERTRQRLDDFWELVDEILNALLFVLVGLEVLVLHFSWQLLLAAAVIIPVTLLARWASVAAVFVPLRRWLRPTPHSIKILTWSALRGGISVALALSLTDAMHRDVFIPITYVVVAFSILVQGLTIAPVIRRLIPGLPPTEAEEHSEPTAVESPAVQPPAPPA